MPLIIIPGALDTLVLLLGILSSLGMLYFFYKILLGPALRVMAERQAKPPYEGYVYEIYFRDNIRNRSVTVGQIDSTINTRMMGIKEDHVLLRIKKELDLEEYDISITPGGQVFYRPPHARRMEMIKEEERFESSELIGHPALIRAAAVVRNNRPLQFVEFELSCAYYMDRTGEERMKFLLTLKRIFPGAEAEPNKKGVYRFSRARSQESESEGADEEEE